MILYFYSSILYQFLGKCFCPYSFAIRSASFLVSGLSECNIGNVSRNSKDCNVILRMIWYLRFLYDLFSLHFSDPWIRNRLDWYLCSIVYTSFPVDLLFRFYPSFTIGNQTSLWNRGERSLCGMSAGEHKSAGNLIESQFAPSFKVSHARSAHLGGFRLRLPVVGKPVRAVCYRSCGTKPFASVLARIHSSGYMCLHHWWKSFV